jgi:hypothetical protein
METEWIIVAPKRDEDVVDFLVERAPLNGIKIGHVLWTDHGPIKLYSCAEDLWKELGAGTSDHELRPANHG